MANQEVKQIRGQYLHIAPHHKRTIWGNMEALRDSIVDHGIISPLVVRDRKSGGYEIVAGVRRFKGGTMADLKTFPCLLLELDDIDAIAMQVAENLEREGLHPIDESDYFKELSDRGMDPTAIAKRFQIKKRDVAQRLKLQSLGAAARKAFVAGKFDHEAALALARQSALSRQTDVLAALDAGSLQPEEITGYCQREFTASLEDVPWRKSDDKLVVKAGACSTCHKRSDVQKDLFTEQIGIRCLDVDCYRGKMDATWDQVRVRLGEVLEQDAPNLFIPAAAGARPVVMRSSGMVDADIPCPYMTGYTWRDAVAKSLKPDGEPPTEYLARDQDGRPRYLMRESIVAKMVRKSDAAREIAEQAAAADPVKPEASTTRADGRLRRSIIQRFSELVAEGKGDTWAWVTERVIEGATARAVAATTDLLDDALKAMEIPVGDKPDHKLSLIELSRRSNLQAKRVATAILIFDEADVVGEIGPAIFALAAICDIDLSAVERELRKSP